MESRIGMARTAVRSGLEKTSKRWDVSLFRNVSTATREASLFTNASAASGLHLNDDTTRALNQSFRMSSGSRLTSLGASSSDIVDVYARTSSARLIPHRSATRSAPRERFHPPRCCS